jgi:hypothetical protein
MNRHHRRAQRAQERKARQAFEQGKEAAKKGEMPQSYYDCIREMARVASEWVHAQPTPPALRWVPQRNDGVLLTGSLDVAAKYLADSPDAFALIAHVDEKTERRGSLLQMTWALRLVRAIPMPDGSWYGTETTHRSPGAERMDGLAERFRKNPDGGSRTPAAVCGHCGVPNDRADHPDGRPPEAGDLSLCVMCAGFNQYAELEGVLVLEKRTDADIEALTGEQWADLRDMQEVLRGTIQRMLSQRMGRKDNAEA